MHPSERKSHIFIGRRRVRRLIYEASDRVKKTDDSIVVFDFCLSFVVYLLNMKTATTTTLLSTTTTQPTTTTGRFIINVCCRCHFTVIFY